MPSAKFFASLFLVLAGIMLQLFLGDARGVWFNFALAALIAASFFLDFFEIACLSLLATFILNSQPAFSAGIFSYIALPLGSNVARKLMPLEPWAANVLFFLTSAIILYLLFGFHVLLRNWPLFLGDTLASLAYSLLVFGTIKYVEGRR